MPQAYSTRFDEAMQLAVDAFRDRFRKSTGIPYLMHLLSVCTLVGEHGGNEEQMMAALLHDYLEDIPGATHEELTRRFGHQVADWVLALSDSTSHPKPPWRERKESYLEELRHEPPELKLISAADKVHNSRSIVRDQREQGDAAFDHFKGGKQGTLWYYWSLVQALGDGWEHRLLDELEATVRQMHELADEPWGLPYDGSEPGS